MLANACPLMEIYRSERGNELNTFLLADVGKPGGRRSILSTLPLYTASRALLERILDRHGVDPEQRETILKYADDRRQRVAAILENESLEDELPMIAPEEFSAAPPVLELSGIFCETDISYSEEEYRAHLEETYAFAAEHPNYTVRQSAMHAFRNLQILVHEDQWVMVSKSKAPAIHFVIRHPKLRGAIENFIPPVTETDGPPA